MRWKTRWASLEVEPQLSTACPKPVDRFDAAHPHAVTALLRQLLPTLGIPESLLDAARELDKVYVTARHPDIRRVLLFGSFARGDWTADSDADLVIVASREFRTVSERAPYQIFADSVPTDTLVYSEWEFEQLASDPSGFVATELASAVDLSL